MKPISKLKNIWIQFWFLPYVLIRVLEFSDLDPSLLVWIIIMDFPGYPCLPLTQALDSVSAVRSKTHITSDCLSGVTRRDIYLNTVGNTANELFGYKFGERLEVPKDFCSETACGSDSADMTFVREWASPLTLPADKYARISIVSCGFFVRGPLSGLSPEK